MNQDLLLYLVILSNLVDQLLLCLLLVLEVQDFHREHQVRVGRDHRRHAFGAVNSDVQRPELPRYKGMHGFDVEAVAAAERKDCDDDDGFKCGRTSAATGARTPGGVGEALPSGCSRRLRPRAEAVTRRTWAASAARPATDRPSE